MFPYILFPILCIIPALALVLWFRHPRFGRLPSGARLERIRRSPHYAAGHFENLVPKPALTEGATFAGITLGFLFRKKERPVPGAALPVEKTCLHALPPDVNALIWFGHASYYMQIDGLKLLVDPHLSGSASPFPAIPPFPGTDVYFADDIPAADYTLITHDHWDHLDYETIRSLGDKAGTFICGLGIGAHLEHWGVRPERILEADWNESLPLCRDCTAHVLTSHHYCGRLFSRSKALWISLLLETPSMRIFLGCDGGYGEHYKVIGERFPGIDLAILENGQYDRDWKYNHMQPEEVCLAALDLGAKALLPVHSAKFELANHPWDEPLRRIYRLHADAPYRLLTPRIGEAVLLQDAKQRFEPWWEGII